MVKKFFDISEGSLNKYTTYFYHKNCDVVYEVVTNGMKCDLHTRDVIGLDVIYRPSSSLPKYIIKKLAKKKGN
jgi:hypothetical protein